MWVEEWELPCAFKDSKRDLFYDYISDEECLCLMFMSRFEVSLFLKDSIHCNNVVAGRWLLRKLIIGI